MFRFIENPAFWASLAALLVAIGIELPGSWYTHTATLSAALCGIVGLLETLWQAGHRVHYERPQT